VANGAGAVTINSNVGLGANQTWTNNSANALTVAGSISGSGNLTTAGSGTVNLSGSNTYTGNTTVSAGTMVVSGTINGSRNVTIGGGATAAAMNVSGTLGSVTAPAAVTIAASGILTGNGTVNGAITSSAGTLQPLGGDSNGLVVASGSVALSSGSTFGLLMANSNANNPTPGAPGLSDYSKLTLSTGVTANISGASLLTQDVGAINYGDLFTVILSGTAVTGTFNIAGASSAGLSTSYFTDASGQAWEINYKYDLSLGTTGNNVSPSTFAAISNGTNVAVLAVPEPNSFAMLAASLGMALGLQRFRRRRV